MKQENNIKVWDPFVRIFHWGLVISFAIAYVSEEEILGIHTLAGYVLLGFCHCAWYGASSVLVTPDFPISHTHPPVYARLFETH